MTETLAAVLVVIIGVLALAILIAFILGGRG